MFVPQLTEITSNSVTFLTDVALFDEHGIRIAFSKRQGGVSNVPYASLNLGAYTGDDPDNVVENRRRLCEVLQLDERASVRINSACQIHGTNVEEAFGYAHEFPDTDALITSRSAVPLLLCFADCLPLIIVSPDARAVSVIHSGWRGTVAGIAGHAVEALRRTYDADPSRMLCYIGPYIGLQNFTIGNEVEAQFLSRFDNLKRNGYFANDEGTANLDLGVAVTETLVGKGVLSCNIVNAHIDTVEDTISFFSYRAENQVTGRHGALACICLR
jgi:YfiH family protein